MIELKTKAEIDKMRIAGRATAQILREMSEKTKPGVTPLELDAFAERRCAELGVIPAFKGYRDFPKSVCISVNNQVVHTIPSSIAFNEGDLVKLDFGVIFDGFHGDSAITISLGAPEADILLSAVTREALDAGIAAMKLGAKIGDISYAIQKIGEESGFYVVKTLTGHGIGRKLHEDPAVPNFGRPGRGHELKEGLVLALEPIFSVGSGEVEVLQDGWTIQTKLGGRSAHWEHTIAMTENGPEILTI